MEWTLAGVTLPSRLLLGTAAYPSLKTLHAAIHASQTNIITVSLKRQLPSQNGGEDFWSSLKSLGCHLLPNTAGCRRAEDAVTTAELARELFQTNWIKLEVIGDDDTLQPDTHELLKASKILVQKGFEVFPYCTEDLIIATRLMDCGCNILMPWGSPIGSGKGLLNIHALETLRNRLPQATLIIDAGIGKPSQAAQAMEIGYDGVLLNSAVAKAGDPVQMAGAFRDAIKAGRGAFEAGMIVESNFARSSTSLADTPFWLGRLKER